MTKYLVTGGCGFIGSHLCEALMVPGNEILVLDDLSTGSMQNLVPGAELMIGDVADPATVRAAMRDVDMTFHLAAIASVEQGVRDPLRTHRVNLTGAINVFDAARSERVPVIYASSAAVYGNPDTLPLRRDAPTRPLSAYGADKLGCELHARVVGLVHGVPTLGLRFFNVFGPRQDPQSPYSGVISIFCERLARGEPVVIFGDGEQTRDFVAVSDVVAVLMAGLRVVSTDAPVLNVCTGRATSLRMLVKAIGEVCGLVPETRYGPSRSGEIRHSLGSPELTRTMLGLDEPMSLRTGLDQVITWLRSGRPGLTETVLPDPRALISAQ